MDAEKWVVAVVPPWRDLKPVFTKPVDSKAEKQEEELSTTPTSEESRIPSRFTCPPPLRQRKPSSSSSSSRCGAVILRWSDLNEMKFLGVDTSPFDFPALLRQLPAIITSAFLIPKKGPNSVTATDMATARPPADNRRHDGGGGGGKQNTCSSYFQKTVCLEDWWLIKVENGLEGKRLGVAGFTSRDRGARRAFCSAPILKRYDVFTLETMDGICVLIKGFLNKARTEENGFPSEAWEVVSLRLPNMVINLSVRELMLESGGMNQSKVVFARGTRNLAALTGKSSMLKVFSYFVFGFPPFWEECAEKCLEGSFAQDVVSKADGSHKDFRERIPENSENACGNQELRVCADAGVSSVDVEGTVEKFSSPAKNEGHSRPEVDHVSKDNDALMNAGMENCSLLEDPSTEAVSALNMALQVDESSHRSTISTEGTDSRESGTPGKSEGKESQVLPTPGCNANACDASVESSVPNTSNVESATPSVFYEAVSTETSCVNTSSKRSDRSKRSEKDSKGRLGGNTNIFFASSFQNSEVLVRCDKENPLGVDDLHLSTGGTEKVAEIPNAQELQGNCPTVTMRQPTGSPGLEGDVFASYIVDMDEHVTISNKEGRREYKLTTSGDHKNDDVASKCNDKIKSRKNISAAGDFENLGTEDVNNMSSLLGAASEGRKDNSEEITSHSEGRNSRTLRDHKKAYVAPKRTDKNKRTASGVFENLDTQDVNNISSTSGAAFRGRKDNSEEIASHSEGRSLEQDSRCSKGNKKDGQSTATIRRRSNSVSISGLGQAVNANAHVNSELGCISPSDLFVARSQRPVTDLIAKSLDTGRKKDGSEKNARVSTSVAGPKQDQNHRDHMIQAGSRKSTDRGSITTEASTNRKKAKRKLTYVSKPFLE
ncbi:hypothetical protein RJ640_014458 [Escallonia rubra]|uniref:SANTA domain-containing protein n=1 Tax=Escallonia rubra TaxID=112253 RepID=A0AA88R4M6_9ASTE|nr:hypothetical protein RJ640_014458 [Escallonia rubra]